MGFSVFIFDFDYTLGDSTKGIIESINYALGTMGIEEQTAEQIRKTVGMTIPNAFRYLTRNEDKEKSMEFYRLFKEKADQIMTESTVLYPDTIPVLSHIKSRGYQTGILTTKFHYRIDAISDEFNIGNLIDTVVGIDDVEKAKPDPEGLLKAINTLMAEKENVLYIGDTVIDAETAYRANVSFCAVTTGTTNKKDFYRFPHIAVISRLSEFMSNGILI